MDVEKILDLQYRKVLTEREIIRGYVETAIAVKNTVVDLSDIEVLSIFMIDLDNLDYPYINESDSELLKEYTNNLLNDNVYEKKEIDIETISNIYKLSRGHRITDELNKTITLKFAKYINDKEDNMLFIGVDSLNALL